MPAGSTLIHGLRHPRESCFASVAVRSILTGFDSSKGLSSVRTAFELAIAVRSNVAQKTASSKSAGAS